MTAEILSIGTELLLGEIVNSNAAYLAEQCAGLGISVFRQTTVGDNLARIVSAFERAFENTDLVIASGGLGPTADDLSREGASAFFKKPMKLHEPSLEKIQAFFNKIGKPMPKGNEKQAYYPEGSEILPNPKGSAPGIYFEEGGKILILLPGPPGEMKAMWEQEAKPRLLSKTHETLFSKTLRVAGLGESEMAQRVIRFIEESKNPSVAPYAKDYESVLRITAKAENRQRAEALIAPVEEEIRQILGDFIYGTDDTSLEAETAKLLVQKKITLATAESCTGGLIASKLISYPGISACFLEGRITYSNESKIKSLGVHPETLTRFGAVSEETVMEMAKGMAGLSGADLALSVSGIAGPGGGSKEKPVGTVWGAVCFKGHTEARRFTLFGSRDQIRNRAALSMIDWVRRILLKIS